jgi:hypothetical protein
VMLVTPLFVRPALDNLARQVDSQALAMLVEDGFDVGEIVPSADQEVLAGQDVLAVRA